MIILNKNIIFMDIKIKNDMINDNKKISNVFSLFIFLAIVFVIAPIFVNAQVDLGQTQEIAASAGLGIEDSEVVIGNIIKIALGFLGLVGLVIVIIAGFKWMTSGGNEEKIKSAKKMLLAGAAGIVVILFSYLIVNFIITKVQEGTGTPGGPGNPTETESCDVEGSCHGCNRVCSGGEVVYSEISCGCSGEQRLRIISYSPRGSNVKLCQKVQLEFSENIKSSTVNSNNIKVYRCNTSDDCTINITSQGTVTSSENIIQFYVDSYAENTTYKVFVSHDGIEGISGKKLLEDFSWNFNTGSEEDNVPPKVIDVFPEGGDICLKSHISAEFSEEMDKISLLNLDNFRLFKDNNTQTDFTFKHSVNANKLILKSNKNFDVNTDYFPLLDGSKIMDSCGNKLDGNKNGIREDSIVDNYPTSGPSDVWRFTSGLNDKCEPVITSVSPEEVYYDGEAITITGQYLSDAVVVFDNQIIVDESTELCIAGVSDKWPKRICKLNDWNSNSISLYVPATGGDLNGIRNGAIKVQTTEGVASASVALISPRIESVSPEEGGPGQFVTINGSGFGSSKGNNDRVVLRPISENTTDGDLELSCGIDSWHDTYIIVSIPSDLELGEYYFQVVKKGLLQDEKWSNTYAFEVDNSLPGPGLCSVSPSVVKYNDDFVATGVRLGDGSYSVNERNVLLGSYYNSVTSTVISWSDLSDGQDTKVTVQTPNLRKGQVGVRVVTQKNGVTKFSNSIPINIDVDPANQFKITYISPASSTLGSYITIYGSGFGDSKGFSSTVKFKNGASDAWFDGDFAFPSVCSTAYWKDDRIIVKVPSNFNIPEDPGYLNSQVKIIKNKDTASQQETNPVAFIVRDGNPAPSICSIDPTKGIAGDSITVYGEYFNTLNKAVFSYGQDDNEVSMSGTNGNSIQVTVPETKTGLLALHGVDTGYGNTVNFEYGENGTTPPPQTKWDFYGWHFETCDNCKIPRVVTSPCVNAFASPSPRSGSKDVPVDARLFFAFEYPDGSGANIKSSTLISSNFELLNCGSEENPICSTSAKSFTIENSNASSIEFSADSNFVAGNWYKFSIKPNRIYDIDNMLLSTTNNEIFFKINSNGGVCIPDTMRINPLAQVTTYEPLKKISYYDSLINSNGCYACSDEGYTYAWAPTNSNLLDSLTGLGSVATATLNSSFRTGTVTIESTAASSGLSLSLFASSTLRINLGCSIFNKASGTSESAEQLAIRQGKCANEDEHPGLTCCWNSAQATCVDDGNSVCLEPYLKLAPCKKSQNIIVQLASPSPANYSTNAPIDAIIHAQFGGYGGDSFKMNTTTYNGGMQIFFCGNSTSTCAQTVSPITASASVLMDLSDDLFVSYGTNNTATFTPNVWYKVKLKDSIKDIRGNKLQQPTEWYFKTTSTPCIATQLSILPNSVRLPVSESRRLVAICSDSNCNVCASSGYQYSWSSASPTIASILENATNISTTTANAIGSTTITVVNSSLNISNNRIVTVTSNCNRFKISSTCNSDSNCCWNNDKCSSNTASCASQCSAFSSEASCEITTDDAVCCWSGTSCLNGISNPRCMAQDNCSKNTSELTCLNSNCCWANAKCTLNMGLCNHGNFTMTSKYPTGQSCLNPMIHAEFDAVINYSSLSTSTVILEDLGPINDQASERVIRVPVQFYSYSSSSSRGVINMELLSPLKQKNNYRVRLLGSIRSIDGRTLNCNSQNPSELLDVYIDRLQDILKKDVRTLNELIKSSLKENQKILSEILIIDKEISDKSQDIKSVIENENTLKELLISRDKNIKKLSKIDDKILSQLDIYKEVVSIIDNIVSGSQSQWQIDQGCSWGFQTNSSPCELSHVEIVDPAGHYYEYDKPNVEKIFKAIAQDAYGNPISRIAGFYSWNWQWTSGDNSLVNIVGSSEASSTIFKSQNKNGNTKATITVKKQVPPVGYNDEDITDEATINLFMCNTPWSFEAYGFKLRYCRDGGLPELDASSVIINTPVNSPDGLLKEYIFRYKADPIAKAKDSNSSLLSLILGRMFNDFVVRVFAETASYQEDLIGIRIYQNNKHLSPSDWYRSTNSFDFKGSPQSRKVDSYDAIVDGRTTYINAGRKFTENVNNQGSSGRISTNIYLISKNQNSSPFTNNIYSQLVDSWQFNATETSDIKNKISQDVKRWQDLRSIENNLEIYANSNKYCTYDDDDDISNVRCASDGDCINHIMKFDKCVKTYPELTSGTYVKGTTNSLWGSWDDNLGKALKVSLPKDPVNRFNNCHINPYNLDQSTCFDSINHIFICPKDSKIYYYEASTHNSNATKALSYKLYSLLNYSNNNMWFDNNAAVNDNIEISNINVCSSEPVIDQ